MSQSPCSVRRGNGLLEERRAEPGTAKRASAAARWICAHRWIGAAALSMVAATLAMGAARAGETRRIDAVFEALDSESSPGCAVGVLRDGQIAYERGFGMASFEHGVPITPRTIFDIGSTSKQFTAAAIVLLAAEGRLSLDDDVRKYVPEIPAYGRRITIRHLLQHTSGLRDYNDLLPLAGHQTEDLTTERDALEILARQKGLNFPTGTEFRYDNTGFFLASVIVKRVSGKPLRVFAEERIFAPLGMSHTSFLDDHTAIIPHKATGYSHRAGGGFQLATSDWEQVGDGGVQTSVEDLALWDENFYTGKVGGKALLDLMQTKGSLADGTPIPYGLGLFLDRYRGLERVQHAGAWAGYRAMLMRFPSRHTSIITLCNFGEANTSLFAEKVADIILEDQLPEPRPRCEAAGTAKSEGDWARLAGTYWNEHLGEIRTIVAKDGMLHSMAEGETSPLCDLGGGRFLLEESGEIYSFDGPGGALKIAEEEAARSAVYSRVPGSAAGRAGSSGALSEYAGTYTNGEVGGDLRISRGKEGLALRSGYGPDATLHPVSGDIFTVDGLLVQFSRDAAKRVTGLTVTNRGVVKIPFRRRS